MKFFDMSLQELENYKPERNEPADFDAFWQGSIAEAQQYELDAQFVVEDTGLSLVDTWDVTFSGYGGQRIKGWYLRPHGVDAPLPCIVHYVGYGGGRRYPHEWLLFPSAGYAFFIMDSRGQGSAHSIGDTPDIPDGANPHVPGFMTQGILNPKHYYYRRLFVDAVRAVDVVESLDDVDHSKIAISGRSQGGGITVAVSGLAPNVALAMPDVPFLSHFERAIGLTDKQPYQEIVTYLHTHREKAERVFETLSYFDGMNFAARAKAECYYSTGLMDEICPPSTVFAAYNQIQSAKKIDVYRFNGHEGGGMLEGIRKLAWLNEHWG